MTPFSLSPAMARAASVMATRRHQAMRGRMIPGKREDARRPNLRASICSTSGADGSAAQSQELIECSLADPCWR